MRKWIPAIAIIALLAAGLFLIRPTATKLASFTLSDGTVVEVMKITSGPKHKFRYDNRWQDYLGYVLPKTLRTNLGAHILALTATNAHSLVLWTRSRSPNPGLRVFEITVADESGVEVLANGVGGLRGVANPMGATSQLTFPASTARSGSNEFFAGWAIDPLPHHTREIGLGFLDRQSRRRVGYLKLPNPNYRDKHPEGLDTLPKLKVAGDIQMKLLSVNVSMNSQYTSRVDWAVSAELLREGAPVSDWQLVGIDVLADGELFAQNWIGSGVWSASSGFARGGATSSGSRGPPFLEPRPGLWPDAIWTLRLWAVHQTNSALRSVDFVVKPAFKK